MDRPSKPPSWHSSERSGYNFRLALKRAGRGWIERLHRRKPRKYRAGLPASAYRQWSRTGSSGPTELLELVRKKRHLWHPWHHWVHRQVRSTTFLLHRRKSGKRLLKL